MQVTSVQIIQSKSIPMRSSLCFLVLLGLLLLRPSEAAAQERVKNRAKSRANQNVDRKVDQAVDEAFDAVGNLFKKKNKKVEPAAADSVQTEVPAATAADQGNAALFGPMMGSNEPWTPVRNDQLISYTMEFTTSRNGKEEKMAMDMAFDTWLIGYVIKPEGNDPVTRLLLDNEAGMMTII